MSGKPPPAPSPQDVEVSQIQTMFKSMQKIAEQCFIDCVNDFAVRKVSKAEDTCIQNCAEKYFRMVQRSTQKATDIFMKKMDPAVLEAMQAQGQAPSTSQPPEIAK